jgi:hypothetical protein
MTPILANGELIMSIGQLIFGIVIVCTVVAVVSLVHSFLGSTAETQMSSDDKRRFLVRGLFFLLPVVAIFVLPVFISLVLHLIHH